MDFGKKLLIKKSVERLKTQASPTLRCLLIWGGEFYIFGDFVPRFRFIMTPHSSKFNQKFHPPFLIRPFSKKCHPKYYPPFLNKVLQMSIFFKKCLINNNLVEINHNNLRGESESNTSAVSSLQRK